MSHLQTKFNFEYSRLLSGEQPWNATSSTPTLTPSSTSRSKGKSSQHPRSRYFQDLLCLKVEYKTLRSLIDGIGNRILLDDEPDSKGARIRENLNGIWRECLEIWKEANEKVGIRQESQEEEDQEIGLEMEDDRRKNAVQTLLAISVPILSKKLSSLDLIQILASSMNDSDEVFNLLVSNLDDGMKSTSDLISQRSKPKFPSSFSIDSLTSMRSNNQSKLRDGTTTDTREGLQQLFDSEQRHLVLQLGICWLSHVSTTSLGSYFLRKDLFLSSTSMIQDPDTCKFSFEVSLFVGLLSTLGNSGSSQSDFGGLNVSSSNPYARRIRDWVDEKSMERLVRAISAGLENDWKSYVAVQEDSATGFGLKWMTDWWGDEKKGSSEVKKLENGKSGNDFSHLPPPTASILLPLFLLSRSNQAFVSVMFGEVPLSSPSPSTSTSTTPTVPVSFLSFISYLFTHSSSSSRSKSYTRLSLLLLCSLIWDPLGSKALFDDSEKSKEMLKKIRSCRQKIPLINDIGKVKERTRLITSALDSCSLFLRHNLTKKLDAGSYILTLKFIQRSILLSSNPSLTLSYSWTSIFDSLFSLTNFLVSRKSDFKINADLIDELIRNLIQTISICLVKSDNYLSSLGETRNLIYEIARNQRALIGLMGVLGEKRNGANAEFMTIRRDDASSPTTPTEGTDQYQLPPLASIPTKLLVSLPSWKPLSTVLNSLQTKLSDHSKDSKSKFAASWVPDSKVIMKIISELDLESLLAGSEDDLGISSNPISSAGTPIEKGKRNGGNDYFGGKQEEDTSWLDREEQKAMNQFVRTVSEDVRALSPV